MELEKIDRHPLLKELKDFNTHLVDDHHGMMFKGETSIGVHSFAHYKKAKGRKAPAWSALARLHPSQPIRYALVCVEDRKLYYTIDFRPDISNPQRKFSTAEQALAHFLFLLP
jgi:hypothetical protein